LHRRIRGAVRREAVLHLDEAEANPSFVLAAGLATDLPWRFRCALPREVSPSHQPGWAILFAVLMVGAVVQVVAGMVFKQQDKQHQSN
jgi:hypothetical protein